MNNKGWTLDFWILEFGQMGVRPTIRTWEET